MAPSTRTLREARFHMMHEIAPTLTPNVRGAFQVRLNGTKPTRGGIVACEVAVALVSGGEVVHQFCRSVLTAGRAVTLGNESAINFAPPGMGRAAEPGCFQARVIGVVLGEAEIELRIVSPGHHDKALHSFGAKTIRHGKTITLNGLEVTINRVAA